MLRTLLLSSSLLLLAGCNDSGSVFTDTSGNGAPLPPVNNGDGGAFLPPTTGGQPNGSGAGGGATGVPSGGGSGAGGGAAPVGGTGGGSGAGGGAAPVGGTGGGAGTGTGNPGGPVPGQPVPEPATMLLVGSGVAGYSWTRRRRAKHQVEAEA